jgi:hypothetical protein
MDYPKFSHKTPHLKGKQHQLDPNIDLKQLFKHATILYVDWDNVGVYQPSDVFEKLHSDLKSAFGDRFDEVLSKS